MDPFTIMALMNGGSGLMQMMNQQPIPGNNLNGVQPINIAAYQPYLQSVMSNGFNPQSQMYQNTSTMANSAMRDQLANRGVLNSSAGDQAIAGLNTQLANAQINNQMSRQQQAFQTVGGFLNPATQTNIGLGQANNQQGWNQFGGQAQNGQNAMGGLQQILSGMSGAYGAYMKNQQQQNTNQLTADQYQQLMNYMQNQNMYMNGGAGGMSYSGSGQSLAL